MVATMVRVWSMPMAPSASAAASSGRTGSATAPEGCSWGRTIVAVFTRALASGAEIVRVSRSSATVEADPKFAAVCRVSISPATRTCAAYPNRASALDRLRQRQQIELGDLPEIQVLQALQGGARGRDFGLCRVQNGVHPHTKNPSPRAPTVPVLQQFSPRLSWVSRCVLALSTPQEPGVFSEHAAVELLRLANDPSRQQRKTPGQARWCAATASHRPTPAAAEQLPWWCAAPRSRRSRSGEGRAVRPLRPRHTAGRGRERRAIEDRVGRRVADARHEHAPESAATGVGGGSCGLRAGVLWPSSATHADVSVRRSIQPGRRRRTSFTPGATPRGRRLSAQGVVVFEKGGRP